MNILIVIDGMLSGILNHYSITKVMQAIHEVFPENEIMLVPIISPTTHRDLGQLIQSLLYDDYNDWYYGGSYPEAYEAKTPNKGN